MVISTSSQCDHGFRLCTVTCVEVMIIDNYPAKSRGISPELKSRSSRIFVLLSITKHSFIAEKLETIFILLFFSPTHEITYIARYLLTTDAAGIFSAP